jgi:CubicO group peptidase (beta-lactamase class C family)
MDRTGPLCAVLDGAIAAGVTPGATVVVGDGGRDVETVARGLTASVPVSGEPVTAATVYDLASLTKPIATVTILMRLVSEGAVGLADAASGSATPASLFHLVGHAAGFPAHAPFFERLRAGERAGRASARDALVAMCQATPRAYLPGTRTIYSDVGFIQLGAALERATGERLDALVARLVTGPIAMPSTRYVDLTVADRPLSRTAAPTEVDPARGGVVTGEVHDENAHAAGGICGHAGLFGTAGDVAAFARTILACLRGHDTAGLRADVVRRFLTTSAAPSTTWRLGWDTPSHEPGVSHAGDRWPRDAVGHTGFTGTSLWLDPARDRYVVLLSNRVHPTRQPPASGADIKQLRRGVMDAAVALLG